MRIRSLFIGLVAWLLVLVGLFSYLIVGGYSRLLFMLTEGLVVCLLVYLVVFYRRIVKPLETIGNGMDLLKEQDFSSRLGHVGQREADRIVDVFNRIMEQLKNERLHLREQNHFLDLLVNASPMGVIILDLEGRLHSLNPAAQRMLHTMDESMWKCRSLASCTHPLLQSLANVPPDESRTVRLSDANIYKCTRSAFMDCGFRHEFFLVETLTHEVFKAEKKAYEKVIRMIAHEVNNTIAGITSTLDTLDDALSGQDEMQDAREVLQVSTDRCYSLSRFITQFADVVRIPSPTLAPVCLDELVLSCKRFMETICMDRHIRIHLDLAPSLAPVHLDRALFEQVLLNIIKNAAESIGNDGDIYIRTTPSPVCLEIADTGRGLTPEVSAKLFTPFFSTKPDGQGIGLMFIREVLTQHRCTFSLRTDDDHLTRFRIWFEEEANGR